MLSVLCRGLREGVTIAVPSGESLSLVWQDRPQAASVDRKENTKKAPYLREQQDRFEVCVDDGVELFGGELEGAGFPNASADVVDENIQGAPKVLFHLSRRGGERERMGSGDLSRLEIAAFSFYFKCLSPRNNGVDTLLLPKRGRARSLPLLPPCSAEHALPVLVLWALDKLLRHFP